MENDIQNDQPPPMTLGELYNHAMQLAEGFLREALHASERGNNRFMLEMLDRARQNYVANPPLGVERYPIRQELLDLLIDE